MVSGPEGKNVMTKSSRDRVKARSAPAISAGRMWGTRTSRNACQSLAPRSRAASSCSLLKLDSLAPTTSATKGKQNETWAMMMDPRLNGQLKSLGQGMTRVKNSSMETPMQISGTTSGRVKAPSTTVLPMKRQRHHKNDACAPTDSELIAAKKAMVNELAKAIIST